MATKKPKGLGLGLEALLGPRVKEAGEAASPRPTVLRTCSSSRNCSREKYQPRTRMDEGSLYELAESIKAQG
jgi:ParB family chromosome partitioning protein